MKSIPASHPVAMQESTEPVEKVCIEYVNLRQSLAKGRCTDVDIIGVDVGGTNTDATLISNGQVVGMAKTPTNHEDLLESTTEVLRKIMDYCVGSEPIQLHLSTTLSTNAIVEGKGEPTAVLAVPGPGINLETLELGFPIYRLKGYIDHRGREVAPLNRAEVLKAAHRAKDAGAEALSITGKFSHRNPTHESSIHTILAKEGPDFSHITLGHRLSGRANFPRRMATAYLNSSVAKQQLRFVEIIERLLAANERIQNVLVLKADGGTMPLRDSSTRPVETILSGPAASIMAARALSRYQDNNIVVVDIGGTTTDIAVIVAGEPLFERNGAQIAGYSTLVPALFSRSVGLGGDSTIHTTYKQSGTGERSIGFELGPTRAGAAAALGGVGPTPTDAAVALGLAQIGDSSLAIEALNRFAKTLELTWRQVAEGIMEAFAEQLSTTIRRIYRDLENVPVYTVSEILAPPDIRPRAVVGLGAPAPVFIPLAAEKLTLPWEVLPFHEGSNAIGAAAARPTVAITLHADTELGMLTIPEMGYRTKIEHAMLFDQQRARQEALVQGTQYAKDLGLAHFEDVHIVEEESFNVVRGFHTVGRIHTIRAQVRPKVTQVKWDKSSTTEHESRR